MPPTVPRESADVIVARVVDLLTPGAANLRDRARRIVNSPSSTDDARIVAVVMLEVLDLVAPLEEAEGKKVASIYRSAALGDTSPGTVRGRQVEIGGKIFQVPDDGPINDGEVIEYIETADAVRVAADSATSESRFAKKFRDLLMADVEKFVARSRAGKNDGPGLFDPKPDPKMTAPVVLTAATGKALAANAKRLRAAGKRGGS